MRRNESFFSCSPQGSINFFLRLKNKGSTNFLLRLLINDRQYNFERQGKVKEGGKTLTPSGNFFVTPQKGIKRKI